MEKPVHPAFGPGLVASVCALARDSLGLLLSRLELAALELSEAREHMLVLLLVLTLTVMCTWFALAFGAAIVVVLGWAAMGWKILLLLFLVFLLAAIGLGLGARAMLAQGKLALPETMNELKRDRDMLLWTQE